MNNPPPVVMKGKLKLKGSAPSSTSQSSNKFTNSASSADSSQLRKRKYDETATADTVQSSVVSEVHLTDAQKRFKQKQQEREKTDAKKLVATSYRDRMNKFNEKLSKLTEHNDIPRVSAAGNG